MKKCKILAQVVFRLNTIRQIELRENHTGYGKEMHARVSHNLNIFSHTNQTSFQVTLHQLHSLGNLGRIRNPIVQNFEEIFNDLYQ